MKKFPLVLILSLSAAASGYADDQLRNVQEALKSQGFYYGEVDGQTSNETTSAIRRFQIRNGLEVTGTLTPETLGSLQNGGTPAAPEAAPAPEASAPAPAPQPPVNLRRNETVEDSDKSFLRREETKRPAPPPPVAVAPAPREEPPAPVREAPEPPEVSRAPSSEFGEIFAGTPYANAPREVQESTIRRVEAQLASRGLYREPIDSSNGPALEEALLTYQRSARLPLSGRLDLETLSALHLLPGRGPVPLKRFEPDDRETSSGPRVYRGIWVH